MTGFLYCDSENFDMHSQSIDAKKILGRDNNIVGTSSSLIERVDRYIVDRAGRVEPSLTKVSVD